VSDAPVSFEMAAEPRFARLVRTSVAAIAALESFSLDRTDDVRLLADEVFNALICAGADRIRFDADPSEGSVRLVVRGPVDIADPRPAFETARRVAAVIAPGFDLRITDTEAVFAVTVTAEPD
jgi:anti-sigma regulatory factor (Ser/Thr protein kinase)